MRLATLKIAQPKTPSERLDGRLAVVSADGRLAVPVSPQTCPNLLAALEEWGRAEPRLRAIDEALAEGKAPEALDLRRAQLMAPLPRSWSRLDGGAFLPREIRGRGTPGALVPSDHLLGPADDVALLGDARGLCFEPHLAVLLDETPAGVREAEAARHIKLVTVVNDVVLRRPAVGGWRPSKTASSFAPYAVTPQELGAAWREGRPHLELRVLCNGKPWENPHAGEMPLSFFELIAKAARERALAAGTILGSGEGAARTPLLKDGDEVSIEMLRSGRSVFGRISQRVVRG